MWNNYQKVYFQTFFVENIYHQNIPDRVKVKEWPRVIERPVVFVLSSLPGEIGRHLEIKKILKNLFICHKVKFWKNINVVFGL